MLTFNYNCYLDYSIPKEKYSFEKANYENMRTHLETSNWTEEFLNFSEDLSTEDLWHRFKGDILKLRDDFVPKVKQGAANWRNKNNVPISKSLREAINKKKGLHRRWILRKNNSDTARASYKKQRNKVKSLMRKAVRKFEKGIANNCKINPKLFWAHVRSKLKTKPGVAPLLQNIKDKKSLVFDDKGKADILQNQFSSVFTKEPEGSTPEMNQKTDVKIDSFDITEDMISKKIKALKADKAMGPDEMHPRLLKEINDYISKPLAIILNRSLQEGYLPRDWLKAFVSPIYKKGNKSVAETYRPISLTSIICKFLESCIKDTVMKHLIENKLLSDKQHGFISGRSTITQLLNYLDKCIEATVSGQVIDTIYFDFAKAFDTVPHKRLLEKLKAYGISGQILKWIGSFLDGRTQIVKVNGESSYEASVTSGIPQGSVLGPILFVIYINDLPDIVRSSDSFLFADDTKIMRQISSENDSLLLQSDIDALYEWSKKWLLKFHPDKCACMGIGYSPKEEIYTSYNMNGHCLKIINSEKDLGVLFDNNLKFDMHINSIINRANRILGIVRKTFDCLDRQIFANLYKGLVRPHLEYAAPVWSPHLMVQKEALENVQRRATRLVPGLSQLSYPERLKALKLPTLAYRRARGDMITVFKILNACQKSELDDSIQAMLPLNTSSLRGHDKKLYIESSNKNIRKYNFTMRVRKIWNNLPDSVINAKDVWKFEKGLDEFWKDQPLLYDDFKAEILLKT